MNKSTFICLILCTIIFCCSSSTKNNSEIENNSANNDIDSDSLKARLNFNNFCSGCHGDKPQTFADRNWNHGNSDSALFHAIKFGYPDEGMPAFAKALSDTEINDLVKYIQKGIEYVGRYTFSNTKSHENSFESKSVTITLDTILKGLQSPWGLAFLPDGEILVTEKFGKLYKVKKDKSYELISGLPEVLSEGQGGLMDIMIHPKFSENNLIFISYSAVKESISSLEATTAILRAELSGNKLINQKILFEAFPYSRSRIHYGSRMAFGKDGCIYFSVGERGNENENPQALSNDLGKIHRINEDGSIPRDNPFLGNPDARPSIYSYGHRNPQGLAFHPETGELWSHEHGPRGGDEINIIVKGANYGWPAITYGINYDGAVISEKTEMPGMLQPVLHWTPSIAPCGMAFVTGNKYPSWKGSILSGSLRFRYLNLTKLDGEQVLEEELLLKNIGRLREVKIGNDEYIYITIENPGYVFRLVPGKK